MLLHDVVTISAAVGSTRSRRAKMDLIAGLLAVADPGDARLAASYLAGTLPRGRVGAGWATIEAVEAVAAAEASLTLADVDEALERAGGISGAGSEAGRRRVVAELLTRATAKEQDFLVALLLGEVRHGALEGAVVDAVASCARVSGVEVRRALTVGGDLGEVAVAAIRGGRESLQEFHLTVFRPVRPMLAVSAPGIAAALEKTGPAAVEYKYDGARIQVHRDGKRVAVYTRNLREITDRVPEIVEKVRAVRAGSLILDGEAVVLGEDGRPRLFQETAGRFGAGPAAAAVSLTPVFFDLLHLDGADMTCGTAAERHDAMAGVLPPDLVVRRIRTDDAAEAGIFFESSLDDGHEGVVVKALGSAYEAGRRGSAWAKVKPVHTLDLVVLAAEWGHGRCRGLLSNLHLGARDPAGGGFVMLGKTFKGLTDEMLSWQTRRFLALETGRDRNTVDVRPEQVVEIAFDGVQSSNRYPGGVALRFARVRGYRDDKAVSEADTIETVLGIHRGEIRPQLSPRQPGGSHPPAVS